MTKTNTMKPKESSEKEGNKLDQTLDASFPASDSPSFNLGSATGSKTKDKQRLGQNQVLMKLEDSNLALSEDSLDVRGYEVKARDGKDLGKVKDMLISQDDHNVHFLEVATGGFLGLGQETLMIPVEVIERTSSDTVHINKAIQAMLEAPSYNPELVLDEDKAKNYWTEVYRWYGYPHI